MSKKKQVAVAISQQSVKEKQATTTPESLRRTLQEFGIDTASQQSRAIGAIYRVATYAQEVDLRVLLSAIGRHQNLVSLRLRHAALSSEKKGVNSGFFLNS